MKLYFCQRPEILSICGKFVYVYASLIQEPDANKIFPILSIKNSFAHSRFFWQSELVPARCRRFEAKETENNQLFYLGTLRGPNQQTFEQPNEIAKGSDLSGRRTRTFRRVDFEPLENIADDGDIWPFMLRKIAITGEAEVSIVLNGWLKFETILRTSSKMSDRDYVEKLTKTIVAFEEWSNKVEASFKLSQHKRGSQSFENVIVELEKLANENSHQQ